MAARPSNVDLLETLQLQELFCVRMYKFVTIYCKTNCESRVL